MFGRGSPADDRIVGTVLGLPTLIVLLGWFALCVCTLITVTPGGSRPTPSGDYFTLWIAPEGGAWAVRPGAAAKHWPTDEPPPDLEGPIIRAVVQLEGNSEGRRSRRWAFLVTRTAHIQHELLDYSAMSGAAANGVVAGLHGEIAATAEAEWPGLGLEKAINRHGTPVVLFRPDRLLAVAFFVMVLAGAVVIVKLGQGSVRRRVRGMAAAVNKEAPSIGLTGG